MPECSASEFSMYRLAHVQGSEDSAENCCNSCPQECSRKGGGVCYNLVTGIQNALLGVPVREGFF